MICLTNCIPPWPPSRQQTIFFDDACGAIYFSEGGGVGLLVACACAAGERSSRSEPVEHHDDEAARVFVLFTLATTVDGLGLPRSS